MKKKRSWFLPVLLIYCLLLLAAIGCGLNYLWEFLTAYEASRPEVAMEQFMEEHDDTYWKTEAQRVVTQGFNEFADPNATIRDYGLDPDAAVTWMSRGGDEQKTFDIRIGAVRICTVTFVPGEEVGFGLRRWEPAEEVYDFGKDTQITVEIPADAVATLNGTPIGEEFLKEEGTLPVDMSHDFDIAPASRIYVVDGLRGPVELKATAADGTELEPQQIGDTEFRFLSDPTESFRFVAPIEATVSVNGVDIADRYTGEAAPKLAAGCFGYYEADLLYAEPEISVVWNGEVLEATELSLGSCYLPAISAETEKMLSEFADGFIHAYVDFTANKGGLATQNFNVLAPYLVKDSEFYDSMNETRENIVWAKTSGLTYHETSSYDYIDLCDGTYLCYVNYKVSYIFQGNPRDIDETIAMLVGEVEGELKVLQLSPTM